MNIWIGIGICVIVATLVVLLVLRAKRLGPFRPKPSAAQLRWNAIVESLIHYTSPVTGVFPHVYSQRPLLPDVMQGIIDAFEERIATARTLGWTAALEPSEYTILVLPAAREFDSDGNYSPAFKVFFDAGGNYDESQYDQEPGLPGGFLFAAEQVEVMKDAQGIPAPLSKTFFIADNSSREYTERVTSYGLDHVIAYYNEIGLYYATMTHTTGGHPLW